MLFFQEHEGDSAAAQDVNAHFLDRDGVGHPRREHVDLLIGEDNVVTGRTVRSNPIMDRAHPIRIHGYGKNVFDLRKTWAIEPEHGLSD